MWCMVFMLLIHQCFRKVILTRIPIWDDNTIYDVSSYLNYNPKDVKNIQKNGHPKTMDSEIGSPG
ncbi:25841_t:CDS:2 [Gigaspora margarita]|uniref:25841_t:CDS:1 n=1 Tax=Gigaspora margarita TaxID=4874 RepID=A0ABN7UF58_GIGMA|nr:25841_t:CDS:2 [Gigaspora margarita]